MLMSSYFTPAMCLWTMWSGPTFSFTTSEVSWPPSTLPSQPAMIPSSSIPYLPATYPRLSAVIGMCCLLFSHSNKGPGHSPGAPQTTLLLDAAADRHLADAEDHELGRLH